MRPLVLLLLLGGCGSSPAGGADLAAPDLRGPALDAAVPPEQDFAPAPDLRVPAPDLAAKPGDLAFAYPAGLVGTWLIGWSGGLDHYSWFRFDQNFALHILEPTGNPGFVGLWPCSGAGTWTLAAKPQTIQLLLPMGCGVQSVALTFRGFEAPSGALFKGVLVESAVDFNPMAIPLRGFKLPDAQCDAKFTSCKLPL